ncbi:MAG: HalD/BesD family halogenase [Ilumatobacteraceae bacterium]
MLVDQLIDSGRYDLGDASLAEECHRTFVADGVCVLPDFLTDRAVDTLRAECDELASVAHRSSTAASPYLAPIDETFPIGHPRRTVSASSVEVVAYDQFPSHSPLRRLYESDSLLEFVRRCLGLHELHRYADPFGALNLAIMRDGDRLGWHFDMTDFVVSIAIQSSDRGGDFENAKQIRSHAAECYDDVAAVLDGERPDRVRTEPMTPGTLMLFNGRWSMHRVTTILGSTPRYVALLAYDTKPGTDSSDTLKLSRYGRLPGITTKVENR